jgi:NDP-mannose synthase
LRINYSREDTPLGTAGPLAMIPDLTDTFLVMNGDVLSTLDYSQLITYHKQSGAVATIAMHERTVKIDLGVIETNEQNEIVGYIEKPSYQYRVSMGIYIFEPAVLRYIQSGERLDFPDLVNLLLHNNEKVMGYPFDGYWLDIGRPDDYEQALEDFSRRRSEFLKGD